MLSYRVLLHSRLTWPRRLPYARRLLPNPQVSRRYYSQQAEKDESSSSSGKPRRLGFKAYWDVYVLLTLSVNFTLLFAYEPLRDAGVIDAVVSSTIFQLVPLKRVKQPRSESADSAPLYQPITKPDEIRLLVLDPGAPGDELRCRLINVRQSWRTRYEALSYTWGDPTVTRPLSCDGHTIDVTVSLHDALSDLRHRRRRRVLWVDAVCINQADNDEKSKQVMLMGSIYSRARRVLIYLGKGDQGVERAMQDLRWLDWKFMPTHVQRYCSRLAVLGPVGNLMIETLPKMKPIPKEEFKWDPVVNLIRRPWFQRTWIIQEAILAKRALVICGDQSVPWNLLERVVVAMNVYKGLVSFIPNYEMIEDATNGISMMRSARRDRREFPATPEVRLVYRFLASLGSRRYEHSKLLDLIHDSRKFACFNPRDKVYGMLGVTNQDTRSELMKPNYDLSPTDVFRNFVLWDILHNKSLRVLGCSWDKAGSDQRSPSWVPDFTKLDKYDNLTRWENRANYHASGNLPISARSSPDGSVLYLKGKLIDRLHIVGHRELGSTWEASKHDVTNGVIQEAVTIWKATKERLHDLDGPLQHSRETFLRALVCDRTDYGQEASSIFLHDVSRMLKGLEDPKADLRRHLRGRPLEAFLKVATSRRFAATKLGKIGYVPKTAVKDDFVVIFHGAAVPSIVRVDGKGKATIVGECYMQGIMEGEAMQTSHQGEEMEFALH